MVVSVLFAAAILDSVAPLDVSCFFDDSNDDNTYPSFPFTLILLHPFSSDTTSTFVFIANCTTIVDVLSALLLKFTVSVFIYIVFEVCFAASCVFFSWLFWLVVFSCSLFVGSSFWVLSAFNSTFSNFSNTTHPCFSCVFTYAQLFFISFISNSVSFFISSISKAFINGITFNFKSSFALYFPGVATSVFSVFDVFSTSSAFTLTVLSSIVFSSVLFVVFSSTVSVVSLFNCTKSFLKYPVIFLYLTLYHSPFVSKTSTLSPLFIKSNIFESVCVVSLRFAVSTVTLAVLAARLVLIKNRLNVVIIIAVIPNVSTFFILSFIFIFLLLILLYSFCESTFPNISYFSIFVKFLAILLFLWYTILYI